MFEKVTHELTQSVCNNDGESLANLFADNGVYHDYIYGSFKGKENIITEYRKHYLKYLIN